MTRPTIKLNPSTFKKMYNDDTIKLSVIAQHFGVSITTVKKNGDSLHLPLRNERVVYDEKEFRRLFQDGVNYNQMATELKMSAALLLLFERGWDCLLVTKVRRLLNDY